MNQQVAGISVREIVEDVGVNLNVEVRGGHSGLDRQIRETRIQKSGLALAGHFYGIESGRIQILGMTEIEYLLNLPSEACEQAVARLFERDLCCVVVTGGGARVREDSSVAEALIRKADEMETPLLFFEERSSRTILALHALLDDRLAPRQRIHGVLLDVFEVGLLLLGSSGVGKSEVALELIMRGHRLVADDVVDCMYQPPGMVFGAPADLLRHHLEVRGLGILNVKDLFGVTAIRDRKRIDIVVQLAEASTASETDRLGLEERYYSLLGVDIPELLVPVRPGRDMASIMEIAARNELLKQAGHESSQEFFGRLEQHAMGRDGAPESSLPRPPATAPRHGWNRPPGMKPPPESSVGLPYTRKK